MHKIVREPLDVPPFIGCIGHEGGEVYSSAQINMKKLEKDI